MEQEIGSWMEFATQNDFSKPVFEDLPGFLASLKGKNPSGVVESLAVAAGNIADAFKKLRDKATECRKLRQQNH
jgi:hypothetical protein